MKKYEVLHNDYINHNGHILYRIKACIDIIPQYKEHPSCDSYPYPSKIKKGDVGGYIENENNLSHKGQCWVDETSKVLGKSRVIGNAQIRHHSTVSGASVISGNTWLYNSICSRSARLNDNIVAINSSFQGDIWLNNDQIWIDSSCSNVYSRCIEITSYWITSRLDHLIYQMDAQQIQIHDAQRDASSFMSDWLKQIIDTSGDIMPFFNTIIYLYENCFELVQGLSFENLYIADVISNYLSHLPKSDVILFHSIDDLDLINAKSRGGSSEVKYTILEKMFNDFILSAIDSPNSHRLYRLLCIIHQYDSTWFENLRFYGDDQALLDFLKTFRVIQFFGLGGTLLKNTKSLSKQEIDDVQSGYIEPILSRMPYIFMGNSELCLRCMNVLLSEGYEILSLEPKQKTVIAERGFELYCEKMCSSCNLHHEQDLVRTNTFLSIIRQRNDGPVYRYKKHSNDLFNRSKSLNF